MNKHARYVRLLHIIWCLNSLERQEAMNHTFGEQQLSRRKYAFKEKSRWEVLEGHFALKLLLKLNKTSGYHAPHLHASYSPQLV